MAIDLSNEINLVTTPSQVVNFDKNTPTTSGVVFTPDTPTTTDVLYVSSSNASTWIYNGSAYVTYTAPAQTQTTPFYLKGTTIDAQSNKTANIQRDGSLTMSGGFYGPGVGLTSLNASNISSGTLATARMGSGTADSTTYLRGDGAWATVSAGGLTKFTEAESTTTPNATVYVESLTALASSTNADISIIPKGAGAFQLAIPDNTTAGGNKRGQYAVDLQSFSRSAVTQVASGSASFASGGRNTASGNYSTAMGSGNIASGSYSTAIGYVNTSSNDYAVALGSQNTASGGYSIVLGGKSNTATGLYGVTIGGTGNINNGGYGALCTGWSNTNTSTGGIVGGYSNNHSGSYGITIGYTSSNSGSQTIVIGQNHTSSDAFSISVGAGNSTTGGSYNSVFGAGGKTTNMIGRQVLAYFNTVVGDAQNTKLVLSTRTTDATLTTLTVGGTAPYFGQNEFTIQNNSCVRFKGTIVGKKTSSSEIAVWDIDGVISKVSGTVTINVNNVNLVINASGWGTPTLTVNGSNGLSVNVIGLAGTNIQWTCYLDATEVVY